MIAWTIFSASSDADICLFCTVRRVGLLRYAESADCLDLKPIDKALVSPVTADLRLKRFDWFGVCIAWCERRYFSKALYGNGSNKLNVGWGYQASVSGVTGPTNENSEEM